MENQVANWKSTSIWKGCWKADAVGRIEEDQEPQVSGFGPGHNGPRDLFSALLRLFKPLRCPLSAGPHGFLSREW
jgi:hypothetical protein